MPSNDALSPQHRRYATHAVSSGLRMPRAVAQDMGVDDRRRDVAMAQELLHGPDVMSTFE